MACLTALISGQTSSLQFQFHIWQNTLRCLAKYLFICGSFLCFQGVINMNFENLFMEDCSRWEISWKKWIFQRRKGKQWTCLKTFLDQQRLLFVCFSCANLLNSTKKYILSSLLSLFAFPKPFENQLKLALEWSI